MLIAIAAGIYIYKCIHYWQKSYHDTLKAGYVEKQVTLDDGSVINYVEGPDNGDALLLIHGQTGAWESYTSVLPELSKKWHVFAVDCYGHGSSTYEESKYYLDANGDDIIWFVDNVIGERTVVSGHSSGGLIASYVAAYGGKYIIGAVLEDPPVFSTEPDHFERSFAYLDSYKVLHDYLASDKSECWEAYYLRYCLWGQLYMKNAMPGLADYAQKYSDKHPNEAVQFFFMPQSINQTFKYVKEYDFAFGEHFYDYTWHAGIRHEDLMRDIKVPTVFLHAKDNFTEDGILMAASTDEQARKAVELIGNGCKLNELKSNHLIHWYHPDVFVDAINSFLQPNQ
ncbi:alpha/beta fold hydrolase [Desulfoscipio gibsoniae]|uniref:Putative hydrolase or acyltransferase of alpha/beta superfamily n=1 Tax=Desulfoscipio gibsoniae DSM 7213 TaxID=767817 RepID=R4KHY4_9FIRM|nr:alpha/beta hydrolase [Desulfoscipio gibsoniae]AGL02823.1 putative hydrolase or acyltransferase of alpha/beta superfamily [Desulfoscipio gibsoniae DSM 7213]